MVAINAYWFALSYLWNGLGPIVLPLLVAGLVPEGIKGSALGLLTAIGMLVAIVVQPVAGALSDRNTGRWGPRRPFMLGGTVADLVFLLGIALAPRYWLLLAAYFGLQLASNVAHGPYQAVIPDRVPPGRWGQASGVKQLAEILGVMVTSQAVGYLLSRGQARLAILSMAFFLHLTLVITLLGVREEPLRQVPTERLWRAVLGTFRVDLHRHADLAWLVASRLFILLGMNLVRTYVLYYVQWLLNVSAEGASQVTGVLLAVLAVSVAAIVYPAGALSDRVGRKPLIVLSGLVGAGGSLLLLLARNMTHLLIFGGVLGLSIGVFLSANWALLTDLVPSEEAGRYLGLTNLATAGASALAGIGGPIIDVFNAQVPGRGYAVLYVLAAACYLVGTALLARVREARLAPGVARVAKQ